LKENSLNFPRYNRKKVFITGGSSGIGKATALILARSGADVCIAARNQERLEKTRAEIESEKIRIDQKICMMTLDISDKEQIFHTILKVIQDLGGLDILINNAGATYPGYLADLSDEVWENLMRVNYSGGVHVTRACLPHFIKQRSGHIVNMASTLGFMGIFGYGPYTASKFALVGFSECLHQDLLPYHINISVVYPPDTDTPLLHEENRIKPAETRILAGNLKVMQPEKVAEIMLRGILRKRMTIIPGTKNYLINLLFRFFPGLVRSIMESDLRKYYAKNPI